ncbi:MAG: hypothetical protein A2Y25_00230 [Candidatus Melainabacteria bacterium GWF2_37_15]|nr:MAG: hypothetical protein A2Y25_00230 [Candidatus Melainabacteria bacterium GWF2_37_15]
MYSTLTKEEMMEWRRTTEKITLEEFASRLGKSANVKKITNDLHDLLLKKVEEPEQVQEKSVKERKPDIEVKISFAKKLNKREELVFNYFCRNRKQKVMVKDIARILDLPNDYVYKYIKNLRSKLSNTDILENADQGGYILNI